MSFQVSAEVKVLSPRYHFMGAITKVEYYVE